MEILFDISWKLLVVVFLVLLNGFFVAAEFAIVKVRDTQLTPMIVQGHRRAGIARRLVHNLDAALSATQLGITLASLGLGWVGEPVFASLLEPVMEWMRIDSPEARHTIAFGVGFSVITFLHIVVGELAPKSLAIRKPLPTTLWIARPLQWFYRVTYPFIWALNHAANWLLRCFGIQPVGESELVHSEEELRLLVSATREHTGGTSLGRDIVFNAMTLRQRVARDVMRPRKQMVVLDMQSAMSRCLELAEKSRYSRFPLSEGGDVDHLLGVVHFKDLFAMRARASRGADLKPVARPLIYVPPTARLEKLLQLFLDRKLHMAIVVDEYGGTIGMVTLENILEELVGQIQDEFDQEVPLLVKKEEDVWELSGELPLHELEEVVGEALEEEGITTTSGWVTHRLGGFPKPGDVVRCGGFELRVERMDGMRVESLTLSRRKDAVQGEEE